MELGNPLIKRVVQTLRGECPDLTTFSTLSPIPGLRQWLEQQQEGGGGGGDQEPQRRRLRRRLHRWPGKGGGAAGEGGALHHSGEAEDRQQEQQEQQEQQQSDGGGDGGGGGWGGCALDSVAHFHLQNGATVHSINWAATVGRGLRNSCGMMVNYKYDLDRIAFNSETYIGAARSPRPGGEVAAGDEEVGTSSK